MYLNCMQAIVQTRGFRHKAFDELDQHISRCQERLCRFADYVLPTIWAVRQTHQTEDVAWADKHFHKSLAVRGQGALFLFLSVCASQNSQVICYPRNDRIRN